MLFQFISAATHGQTWWIILVRAGNLYYGRSGDLGDELNITLEENLHFAVLVMPSKE